MSVGRIGFVLLGLWTLAGCAEGQIPAYIQSNFTAGTASAISSQSVTLIGSIPVGDAIEVDLDYVSAADDYKVCNDTAGNSYTEQKESDNGSNLAISAAVAINGTASSTITITCQTNSTHTFFSLHTMDFGSAYSLTQVDAAAKLPSCSSCTSFSFSVTTTLANDMLVVLNNASGALGTITPGGGYSSDANSGNLCNEYKVASSTGSQTANCSWTTAKNVVAVVLALKAGFPPSSPFVQGCIGSSATSTTVSCQLSSITPNKLLLIGFLDSQGGNSITISDGCSTTYNPITFSAFSGTPGLAVEMPTTQFGYVYYANTNCTASTLTVTVTINSSANNLYLEVAEYDLHGSVSNPSWVSSGNGGCNASLTGVGGVCTSPNITTTYSNEVIFGWCTTNRSSNVPPDSYPSAGSGYNLRIFSSVGGQLWEDATKSPAGTYTATCSVPNSDTVTSLGLAAGVFGTVGGGFSYSQVF